MRRSVTLPHLLLVGLALSACTNRSGDDSTSSSSSSGTPASSSSGGVVSSGTNSSSRAGSSSRASSGVNSSSRTNSSGVATSTGSSSAGSGASAAGGSSTSTQSSAGGGSSSVAGSSNGGVSSSTPGSSSVGGGSSGVVGSSSGVVGSSSGVVGSSSGGSSSGVVITTLAEYCDAIANVFCNPPSCTYSGQDPSRVDCLRGYANACPVFVAQSTAELNAGQRTFDPAAATSCVNNVFGFYAQQLELACLDPANPASNNTVYTAFYGTLTCTAGDPTYQPGLLQAAQLQNNACGRVLPGLVQGSGACGANDVCASNTCDNRPDGGCGTCAPQVDAGPAPLPPGNVDEPCIVDAGTTVERPGCVPGLACNDDSDRCEPFLGQDAPCGPGFRGVCSGACGQRCVTTPDGGFCKPAAALGDPCTQEVFCAQGLSCTPGHDDAGIPDFAAARCTAQAMANDNCSPGYTMENYPRVVWPFTGAFSFGRFPACAGNLRCNIPQGQSEGVCVAITAAATGQPCDTSLFFNCATRGDRCVDEGDGGRACRPRGLAGANCLSSDDCGVNLFCSNGQCAGLRGEGESCDLDADCAGAALCAEHACILLEHVTALGTVCQ